LGGWHDRLHLLDPAHVCLGQDRASTAGVYLVGNTLRGTVVVELIDRHVGASGSKFQRDSAAGPLLRPRDQNHLATCDTDR